MHFIIIGILALCHSLMGRIFSFISVTYDGARESMCLRLNDMVFYSMKG